MYFGFERRRRHHKAGDSLIAPREIANDVLDIGGSANQQCRRCVVRSSMTKCARVAEIAIGKAQSAEEKHLKKPIKNDGDFAEKEGAINIWRHKNIIKCEERESQHRCHTQNIQCIWQRNEATFCGRQIEEITNDDTERDEKGKDAEEKR